MADLFIGLDHGAHQDTVTSGAATTSKTIELRINLGNANLTKKEVSRALKAFERFLLAQRGAEGSATFDNI